MVEKQINIGILACFVSCCRAEQIEMLNAELPQLGFVFLEFGYGGIAFHFENIALISAFSRRQIPPVRQGISSFYDPELNLFYRLGHQCLDAVPGLRSATGLFCGRQSF